MKTLSSLILLLMGLIPWLNQARGATAAREAGYLYLSPVPGAPYVSAQTRFVLVRFENVTPSEMTNLTTTFIKVTGESSGIHAGNTHVATDGRTVIYTMSTDFTQNELVTVDLNPQLAPGTSGRLNPYSFQFMITAPMPGTITAVAGPGPVLPVDPSPVDEQSTNNVPMAVGPQPPVVQPVRAAVIAPNGVSVPTDFPTVTITVNDKPSPGYLFLEPGVGLSKRYTMILDNHGLPIWYRRGRYYDFKIQQNGMITWISDPPSQGFTGFDQQFNYIRTYQTTNGYSTDGHDLKILPDGTYLIIGTRKNLVNMGLYKPGAGTVTVTEYVFQEFTAAGELIFQFRAWDNYDIRLSGGDYPHMNGLEYDEDGNILVSCRQLGEVTKINKDTGDIIWRLNGVNSSFRLVNDPLNGTSGQHNVSALGNGHYMVFDNGNWRTPQISRAVEYALDLTNMTATMVWQFRDTPDKYAYWFGSAQRLAMGNTLINFVRAQYPKVTEVDTNGTKHFEMTFSPTGDTYRAFRLPWTGPVAVPYLITEAQKDNVALVFNKFGDHTVDYYCIYSGTSPAPTTVVAISPSTLFHFTNVVNGVRNYFRVTAVSTNGVESGFSNEESLVANLTVPGQNMVLNGDFSKGTSYWTWQVTPPAVAQWSVTNGISHFAISSGGIYLTDLELLQAGMKLTQGRNYTLEFDAWAAAPRMFQAEVQANTAEGDNYSGIQPFMITPVTNHHTFRFTMAAASDNNARLVFNLGAVPFDVNLRNVSLREQVYAPGDFNLDGCVGFSDFGVLTDDWQKRQSGLAGDLNKNGKVDFADFVIFAKGWSGGSCP